MAFFLGSDKFRTVLEARFKHNFQTADYSTDRFKCIFEDMEPFVDTTVYRKLLNYIEENGDASLFPFQRFFSTCLRRHFQLDGMPSPNDGCLLLESMQGDPRLQLICILCMQYYFS